MQGGKGNCLELPKMSLSTPTPQSRSAELVRPSSLIFMALSIRDGPLLPLTGQACSIRRWDRGAPWLKISAPGCQRVGGLIRIRSDLLTV
jgi:hypothetical protein